MRRQLARFGGDSLVLSMPEGYDHAGACCSSRLEGRFDWNCAWMTAHTEAIALSRVTRKP